MKNAAIVILAIVAVMFAAYGYMHSLEARRLADLVNQCERRALIAEDKALTFRDAYEMCRREAIKSRQDSQRLEEELNECQKKKSTK